jgi:hypothetical protein
MPFINTNLVKLMTKIEKSNNLNSDLTIRGGFKFLYPENLPIVRIQKEKIIIFASNFQTT